MIKIIQNTEVINPCDYDQGSSMYFRCEECIIQGCTRDTKRPFGTGRSCHDISIDECWESNCIDCSATTGYIKRPFGEGRRCQDIPIADCDGIECIDCCATTGDTKRPFGTGRRCQDISIDECDGIECDDCGATVGGAR